MNKLNSAFTLVELAIVIVIIGLLVGGVLQGQELIKQAEVRTLVKDYESYKSAYIVFKDKYKKLPGDMENASSFWPGASNGDGSGDWYNASLNYEGNLFYHHTALAGLIKGTYQAGTGFNPGVSSPAFKNGKTGYFGFLSSPKTSNVHFGSIGQHILFTGISWASALSPQQTITIDTKMDDGRATTGLFFGLNGEDVNAAAVAANYCNTWDGTGSKDWQKPAGCCEYNLTNDKPACRPLFRVD